MKRSTPRAAFWLCLHMQRRLHWLHSSGGHAGPHLAWNAGVRFPDVLFVYNAADHAFCNVAYRWCVPQQLC